MTVETDGGDATVALGAMAETEAEEVRADAAEGAARDDAAGDIAAQDDTAGDATARDDAAGDVAAGDKAARGDAADDDAAGDEAARDVAADDDAAGDEADDEEDEEDDEEALIEEGEIAGDYLEQLLDVLDFDGDIDLDVEGDRAVVSIDGGRDLSKLVGRRGEVLDALQELTRLAVQQATGVRSRLMLDVAGWRAKRRAELTALGTAAAQRVLEAGKPESLSPMTPFERKIVHDAVAAVEGVVSESEGVEPNRRVVVLPA